MSQRKVEILSELLRSLSAPSRGPPCARASAAATADAIGRSLKAQDAAPDCDERAKKRAMLGCANQVCALAPCLSVVVFPCVGVCGYPVRTECGSACGSQNLQTLFFSFPQSILFLSLFLYCKGFG